MRRRGILTARTTRAALLLGLLALTAASVLLPFPARAQPTSTNVEAELERTDRILERAREQVGVSTNNQAGGLLEQAVRMQREARDAFRGREYRKAMTLTLKARDLARRSLETAEIDAKATSSIRDLIDSTEEMIRDASALLRGEGNPQADRLLELSRSQLQSARDAYRGREYRKAITMAGSARDLAQRALDLARHGGSESGGALQRTLDRTQAVLQDVAGALRDSATNPKAQGLYDQASALHARALTLQKDGRPAQAFRLAMQARQLALEALLLLNRTYVAADVRRAVEIVDQLLADLEAEIAQARSGEATSLLDSARSRQAEAREALARGKLEAALGSARLAEGLLRRAAEAAGLR